MSRFVNPVPQLFLDDGSYASSGRLYFYENKNYAVLKATYSQQDNTVPNTNPLKLDGQGRVPPCFGEGLYSVKFYAANPDNPNIDGALQWTRDDVSLSDLSGQFELWNPVETYSINDIVKDTIDGLYYQLWGAPTSKGEQPSLTLTKWEQLLFITVHNLNKSYKLNEIVFKTGYLYRSNANGNVTVPPSASWENLTFNSSVATDANRVSISAPSTGISGPYSFDFYNFGQIVFFSGYVSWVAGGVATVTIPAGIAAGFRPSYDFAAQSFRNLSLGVGMVNFLASGDIDLVRGASTGSGLSYVSGHYKKA